MNSLKNEWGSLDRERFSLSVWLLSIWHHLQTRWDLYEWPIVIGAGLFSVIMGTIGFWQYYQQLQNQMARITLWDCLYSSLQLFSLQGPFEQGATVPFLLELARFTSPAIAAYTFFQALKEIFQRQVLLFDLGRAREHFIICGLGRKGVLLARELRKENHKVIVIEQNGLNEHIKSCSETGALIIIGDARDPAILNKAGVQRAKHLIAVCGEDSTNAEIAEQMRSLADRGKIKGLTCTIHIVDTYLWTLFREREFTLDHSAALMLDFFNVYDSGARILLRETIAENLFAGPPLHMLIIGMGDLGQYLVIHASHQWCLRQADRSRRLKISIVDPDIHHKLDILKLRYPLIECACDFTLYPMRADGSEFRTAIRETSSDTTLPVTHAYICLDDISSGLQTGFTLLRLLQGQKVNILVRMSEDSGLASFLREVKGPDTVSTNLNAFGLLDRTCKLDLFDDGTHESLARVIHEAYVEREIQHGHSPAENPNLVAWEALNEEIRKSNRYQANYIGIQLNAIGCGYMPWQDFGAEKFSFNPDEIERMARMEHERWMQERKALGWKQAWQRDTVNKEHPDLLLWDDGLSDEAKEKTRQAVQLIPNLLARAGFQIYRLVNQEINRSAPPAAPVLPVSPRYVRR